MFSKKCPNCNNKVKNKFEYCPSCGQNLKSKYDSDDYGILGKNDFIEDQESQFMSFGDKFIDRMFSTATKLLERQLKALSNEMRNPQSNQPNIFPNLNVHFFVNGKRMMPQTKQIHNHKQQEKISREKLKKFSKSAKLPKKEPKTKLKRVGNRIVYELQVPGVNNIDDILINQLENSIEIKALSDKAVYHKTLNINLPVARCQLVNGSLFVELGNSNATKPL